MTAPTAVPYAGSLRRRIEGFYLANPDEWLTWDDICLKFECTKEQASIALHALRQEGRLNTEVVGVVRIVGSPLK